MKKTLVLMITLFMALSLTACGGVDKDAVTEAFNSTNTENNTVVTFATENLDKVDQATLDAINEITNAMAAYKAEIESDDLSQERADEIIVELKEYPAKIAELKTKVDALIESGGAGATEEQVTTLTQIIQSLTDVHAKYAEYYDSYDDDTKDIVDKIAQTINDISSVLDGSMALDSAQADELIQSAQEFLEVTEMGWTEIEAQLAE